MFDFYPKKKSIFIYVLWKFYGKKLNLPILRNNMPNKYYKTSKNIDKNKMHN